MFTGLLASKLLYSITLTLLHFLWQGGVTALALKITLQITPPQKAQLRYAFASLAMLLNLMLPFATFYLIYNADVISPINSALLDQIVPINHSTFALFNSSLLNTFTLLSPYIALFWIGISALLTVKLGIELHQVKRLSRTEIQEPSEALLAQFTKLSKQLNLRFPPKLIISLRTDVPMAIGVLKPMVLIPFSMLSGLTPEQLNMLILHELAHIRRHDYLINIIQTLIETLFFFHPCCYWISKQVRKEREYCCDDIAVKHCHDPVAYAHTLADTASVCHKHRQHSIPRMAMAASGGDLTLRVLRLVKVSPSCTSSLYFPKGLALLGMLMLGLCLGIQLYLSLHSPHNTEHNKSSFTTALVKNQSGLYPTTLSYEVESLAIFSKYKDEYHDFLSTEKKAISLQLPQREKSGATPEILAALLQASLIDEKSNITAINTTISEAKVNNSSKTIEELAQVSQEAKFMDAPNVENMGLETIDSESSAKPYLSSTSNNGTLAPDVKIEATVSNDVSLSEASNIALESNTSKVSTSLKAQDITQQSDFSEHENLAEINIASLEKNNIATQNYNAELIKSIDPRYPAAAQLRGLELDVMVNFTVNTEGKVEGIEFESRSKSHYFKNAIRSAMKKWRFLPAQENGKPVESTMTKIFSFNLLT